jgi:hypothetical protein
MSWIIQSLLNNKNYIREKNDIESDQFNDLILVEKTIEELSKKGLLSTTDLDIIAEMSGDVSGFLGKPKSQRETENKKYSSICDRIAFYMGGYFTDEGYLAYMKTKHRLTEDQVETMRNYIASPFKHKIARKGSSVGYAYKSQGTVNEKTDSEPEPTNI